MSSKQITAEALRFWIKKRGYTQAALAEKTGLSQNYISQIHTGARDGSIDAISQIAEAFDLNLPEFFACKDDLTPEIVFVEKVKARPRAGNGGLETDNKTDELYAFHSKFIAQKRGTAESMKIFEVSGDSMEPTLNDGDMIMVNLADKDIRTGHIYLLRMGEGEASELMVKRLERRPGNMLLIRSDNDRYEDIPVNTREVDGEIQIFGRMVWSCREY